jgi:hypothetical protein
VDDAVVLGCVLPLGGLIAVLAGALEPRWRRRV